MKNIILEGPDNSGKTTLSKVLLDALPSFSYAHSGGPEQYPGEILIRIRTYMRYNHVLFDRHPCISHPIYSMFSKKELTTIPQDVIDAFYQTCPFIIYCSGEGDAGVTGTLHEGVDTPEHLAMVEQNAGNIRNAYQEWAPGRASITYRIGDDYEPMFAKIREYLRNV